MSGAGPQGGLSSYISAGGLTTFLPEDSQPKLMGYSPMRTVGVSRGKRVSSKISSVRPVFLKEEKVVNKT